MAGKLKKNGSVLQISIKNGVNKKALKKGLYCISGVEN